MATNSIYSEQGDYALTLSPFGGLYSFKLFSKQDGIDTTTYKNIDLTNTDIELHFYDGSNEITVTRSTDIEDYSLSDGYVVFKVSKEDAQKALAMKTKRFYLVQNVGDINNTIFEGEFGTSGEKLSDDISELQSSYDELLLKYNALVAESAATQKTLQTDIESLQAKYDALNANYVELLKKYNDLQGSMISANIIEES